MSLTEVEEQTLIARAQGGDREAFDRLYAVYENELKGFIRARASNDAHVEPIAQDTRLRVHERIRAYDPARGSFRAFAKYSASIILIRFYTDHQHHSGREVLFSGLSARYPALEQESEIGDLLARMAGQSNPSVEEELRREEEADMDVAVYDELLRITFGSASPPHQLIVLGFCKLLEYHSAMGSTDDGSEDKTRSRWTPQRVVAELSETPLNELATRLEREYVRASQLPEEHISRHFAPLRQRLRQTLGEVVSESRTRTTYAALLDCVVGETTLRQYYTHFSDPTQDISHWWEAVRRRIWSDVRRHKAGPLNGLLQAAERRKQAERLQRAASPVAYVQAQGDRRRSHEA